MDSVDVNKRQLQVRQALQRKKGGGLMLVPTKSGKSRSVALQIRASDALRRHGTRQLEQRLAAGKEWPREVVPGQKGLVFTTKKGTAVEPKTLDVAYKRLLSKAGLPDFRLHDLRHSCATQMMEQGVNPKVVAEMLGHSTISITLDLYSHVTPTLQEEAVARMDAALSR